MKILAFIIFMLFGFLALGQSSPTIYGNITDAQSSEKLVGASIVLISSDQQFSTISGDEGYFSFTEVTAGRYKMEVSYLGYQSQKVVEILTESGRSTEINIQLTPTAFDLPMAIVRPGATDLENELLPGAQLLTIEETRRLPATFNDPARQLIAYPGVVNTNDQANNISVRGNSPVSLSWRLEGAEILNPNHLSNAGNRLDRVSEASGGVNMLSAQMLNTSAFYAGVAPVEYGNIQGGLMDMKMRSGNREKWEGTFQLGLLGLDASFEGPFSKNKSSSYLFNVRYSTLGLLSALGVNLGDEKIEFLDIALHLNFPTKKLGTFSIFGMTGGSRNTLRAVQDSTIWETERDAKEIRFFSDADYVGIKHFIPINKKGSWETTAVFSRREDSRDESSGITPFSFYEDINEDIYQHKLSLRAKITYPLSQKLILSGGIEDVHHFIGISYWNSQISSRYNRLNQNSIRTFGHINLILSNQLRFKIGATFQYDSRLDFNEFAFLPNFSLNFSHSKTNRLQFAYSKSMRHQPYFQYFAPGDSISVFTDIRSDLQSFRNDNLNLSHEIRFEKNSRLRTEIYFQKINNAATYVKDNRQYSSLNFEEFDFPGFGFLNSDGLGRNYGMEILWHKYLTEDYYFLLNTTLFKSEYKNEENSWRPTRYDSGYLFNLTGGREFRWKRKWDKTLGVNLRFTFLGNLRYTPIDLASSIEQGKEILSSDLYSEKLDPYLKGDLSIYLRTDKKKYSSSLSLNVQNFFNRKNDGYFWYDRLSQTIQEKKQLGLIPILNWRISI